MTHSYQKQEEREKESKPNFSTMLTPLNVKIQQDHITRWHEKHSKESHSGRTLVCTVYTITK